MKPLPLLTALFLAAASATFAADKSLLDGVKRIVFLGDSITYSGGYVDILEAAFRVEHPDRAVEFINIGLPSETVSGLSEPGHAGGQFPNKANDVVEWRGTITAKGFRPYAVIYRINSTNPDNNKRISRLLVIKLDGANSKVIGHTQGAKEDAEAKALADANR